MPVRTKDPVPTSPNRKRARVSHGNKATTEKDRIHKEGRLLSHMYRVDRVISRYAMWPSNLLDVYCLFRNRAGTATRVRNMLEGNSLGTTRLTLGSEEMQ